MTRITANIILLIMAGVWAYISYTTGEIAPITDKFIYLALGLASGELVPKAMDKYKSKNNEL